MGQYRVYIGHTFIIPVKQVNAGFAYIINH